MMNNWLEEFGFVPLLDGEVLKLRHAVNDKTWALGQAGYDAQADGYARLLAKISGLHGRDYKIVPLSEADREMIR